MPSRDHFENKRIALIGLGPHGELVSDAKFLIKAGAILSVYDLKSEARLKSHLVFLRSLGLANYVCGSIPADDLLDMDLIILSSEYPRDSAFLKAAREKNIRIEYAETLFFRLAPPVTLIGIMGVSGKATVLSMLAPMLEAACAASGAQNLFIVDPESESGALDHLRKIKSGDIVLSRLTPGLARELRSLRISPHVAIFTTVPPAGSYAESPFDILSYQTYNNFIIGNDAVIDATHAEGYQTRAKMLRTKASLVPAEWKIQSRGNHDRDNAALALQAGRLFKVGDDTARRLLEAWKPLRGRLEPVKKLKGVEFCNDTGSISPDSTLTALMCLSEGRNVVLIFGGADSGADYRRLYAALPHYAHSLIVIPGSGTVRERKTLEHLDRVEVKSVPSVEAAVRLAMEQAKKGDKILFSPGFEAGGLDGSRKDRGERFVRAVRAL